MLWYKCSQLAWPQVVEKKRTLRSTGQRPSLIYCGDLPSKQPQSRLKSVGQVQNAWRQPVSAVHVSLTQSQQPIEHLFENSKQATPCWHLDSLWHAVVQSFPQTLAATSAFASCLVSDHLPKHASLLFAIWYSHTLIGHNRSSLLHTLAGCLYSMVLYIMFGRLLLCTNSFTRAFLPLQYVIPGLFLDPDHLFLGRGNHCEGSSDVYGHALQWYPYYIHNVCSLCLQTCCALHIL